MKRVLTVLALLIVVLAAGAGWYVYSKQPTRQGMVELQHLQGSVTVRYDERGVPHIRAENETDLYRALGYVQAQDRLFQMEVLRRLARGELAEVLGPKLLDTDKLMRSLRIRERAETYVASAGQAVAGLEGPASLSGRHQPVSGQPRRARRVRRAGHSKTPVHRRGHHQHRRLHGLQFCRGVSHRTLADLRARPTGRRLPEHLRSRLAAQRRAGQGRANRRRPSPPATGKT